MKQIIYILLVTVLLVGCKSSRRLSHSGGKVSAEAVAPACLSSKLQLTVPNKKGGSLSVGGTMKMKANERVQISLLMPILRTEVARIEMTPEEVLVVDRMNRRYVRASRKELKGLLPKHAEYARVEKLLFKASLPGGKSLLTGKDVGLPSLEKAQVRLYDFSSQSFSLNPTELSSRYRQVSLEELIELLAALL